MLFWDFLSDYLKYEGNLKGGFFYLNRNDESESSEDLRWFKIQKKHLDELDKRISDMNDCIRFDIIEEAQKKYLGLDEFYQMIKNKYEKEKCSSFIKKIKNTYQYFKHEVVVGKNIETYSDSTKEHQKSNQSNQIFRLQSDIKEKVKILKKEELDLLAFLCEHQSYSLDLIHQKLNIPKQKTIRQIKKLVLNNLIEIEKQIDKDFVYIPKKISRIDLKNFIIKEKQYRKP